MPTQMVSFAANGNPAPGFLARPEPATDAGVVVIQEWWGLVPHIKEVTERFAREGYTALAPDLFHGKSTVEAAEAQHLMEGLDWGRAVKEIAGAVAYLRQEQGLGKVAIIGFCMGGALAVLGAGMADVDAYVSFYGFPPQAPAEHAVAAPGLIVFGEHESFFSVPDAQAFAARQRERGRPTEVVIYSGAGHAFFNDHRPSVYHREAAESAWKRTMEHLRAHLRTG